MNPKTLHVLVITSPSLYMYIAISSFLGVHASPTSRGTMMTVETVLYNEKANVCCDYPLFPRHYNMNGPEPRKKRPDL